MSGATGDNRWDRRFRVTQKVELRVSGGRYTPVDLVDMSLHGFRMSSWARHHVGDLVWIKFPPLGSVEARVKWVRGHTVGCMLARPFHPAVFDQVVASYPTDQEP
jgi:hypothetical protein